MIDQARDTILDMRVQAFKENRQLTPSEVSRIDLISKAMAKKTQEKEELLNGRETATAYRLQELKTYKHQFDTT